ncbi:acetolactate synthase small subunit [Sinobacterium caligoides]|uniref:acetolactate synthase n=1 Tax=Sinobacterium caligoides TaxID=933926 RepID=A0A3N2E0B4_9GAMM|nr:acetolactate synthase small subunit [Sinobacterium caligoides]ROS05528.1 acetolactate synthase small subunit [Sinobacterium caligoides]
MSKRAVLELKVRNHPGTMSHVCGLFARRAYNMEGILCMPMSDSKFSKIWLLVDEDKRLDQVILQTNKLIDVQEITQHAAPHEVFEKLECFFNS